MILALAACSAPPAPLLDAGVEEEIDSGVAVDSGVPDAGFDAGVIAPTPSWKPLSDIPMPDGRWGWRMVSTGADQFIAFGGTSYPTGAPVSEAWSYTPSTDTWSKLATTGEIPAPRYCECLAYLPTVNQLLLVGGRDDNGPRAPEAYTLDLATKSWQSIAGAKPWGVIGCTAEWLPKWQGGRAIVFGGGTGALSTDTWSYDPATRAFTLEAPAHAPGGRSDPVEFYDDVSGAFYVWGGAVRVVPPLKHLSDMWKFDGTDWSQVPISDGPAGRRFPASGFDSARRTLFFFSGTNETQDFNELWAFDVATEKFSKLSADGAPAPRAFAASAYRDGTLYFFGGFTQPTYLSFADAWSMQLK